MTPEEFYALQPNDYIRWDANPEYEGYVGCVFKVTTPARKTWEPKMHAITLSNGESWGFPVSECSKLHHFKSKDTIMASKTDLFAEELSKTARILCEDEQPNSDTTLQVMVGDPADVRTSTFVQFKPNPGTMQLPNPLSPIQGDEIFFAYMIPGAIFQAHDGTEWWIESYSSPDEVEISNRWYPRIHAFVSLNDVRRSIHQWIEPITQTVPPPPPGVDYGAQPVKIMEDPQTYGTGEEPGFKSGIGGW